MWSSDPVRVVTLDTIGTTKAYRLEGVFPAIAMDIQIAVRTARGCALTVSITQLGSTVSSARKATMGTPSVDPVGCVPALTPTVSPLAVPWMEEL